MISYYCQGGFALVNFFEEILYRKCCAGNLTQEIWLEGKKQPLH